MKTVYFLLLCIAFLAGCSPKAQVVTLRGNNVKPTDSGLILDNDTLTLAYNFASKRGNMRISITNKLNQPLYVDWKRSSLIVGQDKVDYWYDVAAVQLNTYTYNSRWHYYSIGSITGTISKEDQIGFIPPHTKLEKQQFMLVPSDTLVLSGSPAITHEKPIWNPDRKKPIDINTFTYGSEASPLIFRNYLTLSTDKDFKTEFHLDTKFWASDVKVIPLDQITGRIRQYDGTYSVADFRKPDAFYIPLPLQP